MVIIGTGTNVALIFLVCYFLYCLISNSDSKPKLKGKIPPEELKKFQRRLRTCDPFKFETFCSELFRQTNNYKKVVQTPPTGDGGKDIILTTKDNKKIYVEVKRYNNKSNVTVGSMVGRPILQKLIGAMSADGVQEGLIVTTGNIHQNAYDYIKKLQKNTPYRIGIMQTEDIMKLFNSIPDNLNLEALLD